ncbi:MAG: endonuclease/exonuclease/phosphatase family protein [Lewinellaceae bacterium]|nr:endonuclease/exonuclease/phosphatase family protein [Lewinellaceae bacterium]
MLKIVSALVILLTALSYLTPLVNPGWFKGFVFLGTAFPWLLLANLVLILAWTWRLNRFALYHVGMLLLGWQYVTAFIGLDIGKNPIPSGSITMATHNLGHLWPAKANDATYHQLALDYAAFLKKNAVPDILCTQETRGKFYKVLASEMGYPYTFNLKKGTVILSRYPMRGGGEIPFTSTKNSSLWVDVKIGKQVLRVYNVHLQSNKVTADTEKMLEEGDINQGQTWDEINRVLEKVGGATSLRAEQAQQLREHMDACPNAFVVCGDFNDTPNSFVYRKVSDGLNDTFRDKGFGLGTTFAGALPFLRIDYILTSPEVKTYSCRVLRGNYSDHYPVVAVIGL